MLYSLIILVIFILFMKQYHVTFYISIVLLLGIFSLNQYLVYYKNLEQQQGNVGKYDTLIRRMELALVVLGISLVILLVIGNIIYLYKQRSSYGGSFNWITFYFGASPCGYVKVNPSNSSQKGVAGVVDGRFVPGTAGLDTLEGNTLH